jgi:hypothetical protein
MKAGEGFVPSPFQHNMLKSREQSGSGVSARRPVSRVLSPLAQGMTIHLGRSSPSASRDRPGWRRGNPPDPIQVALEGVCHPYLVLLPVGFTLPPPLPAARCALTAPFHPCRPWHPNGSHRLGGLLSVALSLRSPSPGVTRHRVSVEPGLSSPRPRIAPGREAAIRPSGTTYIGPQRQRVKSRELRSPWRG